MKLTCPACGATTSLEAMTEDAAARKVAALFGELPPEIARHLPAYLALFRPAKTGLRWTRAHAIIDELLDMYRHGFTRRGRTWRAPPAVWAQALQEVCNRSNLSRPLKNHGYLMEVIAGLAERHAAVAEREHEKQLQSGRRPGTTTGRRVDPVQAAIAHQEYMRDQGYISNDECGRNIEEIRNGGTA